MCVCASVCCVNTNTRHAQLENTLCFSAKVLIGPGRVEKKGCSQLVAGNRHPPSPAPPFTPLLSHSFLSLSLSLSELPSSSKTIDQSPTPLLSCNFSPNAVGMENEPIKVGTVCCPRLCPFYLPSFPPFCLKLCFSCFVRHFMHFACASLQN